MDLSQVSLVVNSIPANSLGPRQSYLPHEWEEKQPIITRLYRDEAKSLSQVLITLSQQHSFHPTEKMLKKRIKKWDLDRNNKQPDMLYALKIGMPREDEGKKTVFVIRGRVIPFDEVKRYFRRKGVPSLPSLMAEANVAVPTTRIEHRSPQPEGTNADNEEGKSEFLLAKHSSNPQGLVPEVMALPNTDQIDGVITPVGTLRHMEVILRCNFKYYDALSGVGDLPDSYSELEAESGLQKSFLLDMLTGIMYLG